MTNLKTEHLDLNIDNYKLTDLLNLFNIDINFNENDLKEVKKKVIFMHPDKSGLDKSIFLFYSAVYKLLANIYNTNNEQKNRLNNNTIEYKPYNCNSNNNNLDENTKSLLNNIMKNNSKDFNNWFNTQFEKHVENNNDGYTDWLKSTPTEVHEDVDTLDEMHKKMSKHRKHITTLSKYDGFHDSSHTFGSSGTLITEQDANYSSGLFGGNFQYDDLRKVYTETLIPVDVDNFNNEQQTLDNLMSKRDNQNLNPISSEDGLKQLNKQNDSMKKAYMLQNFELIKEEQHYKKKNDDLINNLKLLKNTIFK